MRLKCWALRFVLLHPFNHLHEVAGSIAISFIFEGNVEIGRSTQHIEQAPQRKASRAIALKPEIDPHLFDPRPQSVGRNFSKVRSGEIALELIVEVHMRIPVSGAVIGMPCSATLVKVNTT